MSQEIQDVFHEDIDLIIGKLSRTKDRNDIVKWLDNFDEKHRLDALEILHRLVFVSQEDLFYHADDMIKQIENQIDKGSKVYFYPIAKYGKSATLMSYYIQKSSTFKRMQYNGLAEFLSNEHEISSASFNENSVLVFFDDFFGSGGSFAKHYKYLSRISSPEFLTVKQIFAACIYFMEEAKKNIMGLLPNIILIGEIHHKIFGSSPKMFLNQKQIDNKKNIAYQYSQNNFLFRDKVGTCYNLGYKDTEALISFAYMPPNNTLPIIWSGRSKWVPLMPRMEDEIVEKRTNYKEQLIYAASKKELGLPISFPGFYGVTAKRFIIFGLLRMINQNIPIPQIAVLLGVQSSILDNYISIGNKMGLITEDYKLTDGGVSKLKEILKLIEDYKLQDKKEIQNRLFNYLPKTISGK